LVSRVEDYAGVDEVLKEIKGRIKPIRQTQVLPINMAYGRISAADLTAPTNIPAFATSHMDGFAVMAEDLREATSAQPVLLTLSGTLKLGTSRSRTLRHGEAIRVATGSKLPAGTNIVLPAEDVEQRENKVVVNSVPEPGTNVYGAGRDVRKGELVLAEGRPIRSQDIGLLLAFGFTRIGVRSRPKLAVLATGSELTDSSKPSAGKTRNTHSPVFLKLIEALGGVPVDMGIVRDERKEVAGAIRRALDKSDVVLTLGGTSVGPKDVVGGAITDLHPSSVFHGIRMDRGRVSGIAMVRGKPVLMMPGPIQGAMNAFLLFAVPTIDLLSGRKEGRLNVWARMGADWHARKKFANFTKVVYVRLIDEGAVAEPIVAETESMALLTHADGYLIVPEETTQIQKGSNVKVSLLPGFSYP
jgi:molybdenum cofactor synthesis domain-containing protein